MEGPVRYYVHDPQERKESPVYLQSNAKFDTWVNTIAEILSRINPLAKELQAIRTHNNAAEVVLDIGWRNDSNELAIVYASTLSDCPSRHCIAFKHSGTEVFVDICSPLWEPLQFPLLFPEGQPGFFRLSGSTDVSSPESTKGKRLTAMWWYRQMMLRHSALPLLGRLANEYILDGFSRIEDDRLRFVRMNQGRFHVASRAHILDETVEAEGGAQIGRVYLPSSFPGSVRYQRVLTADGMAIVSRMGKPTFFITMTCNPHWPEITRELGPRQTASDRPDITVRVFHAKVMTLLKMLRKGTVFGAPAVYLMCVVEFQKRGLPHVHVAVRIRGTQPHDSEAIDQFISAEIPTDDPELAALVNKNMIHHCQTGPGRCRGFTNTNSAQQQSAEQCSRRFPFAINTVTHIDNRGYCIYRRNTEADRMVVPYNPKLLLMFDCHINVELAHTVNIIAYLYKYMYKGPDRAKIAVVPPTTSSNADEIAVDEVADYINARYVSAAEAAWRICGFVVNHREPAVTCISTHLPDADSIFFSVNSTDLRERAESHVSPLMRYFGRPENSSPTNGSNQTAEVVDFDSMTFVEYNEKFVVSSKRPANNKPFWRDNPTREKPDGQQIQLTAQIMFVTRRPTVHVVRLRMLTPRVGDLFFLRLLLNSRPCRSFLQARTVDGVVHPTFRAAAEAIGLLDIENEFDICMQEAVDILCAPSMLRGLFVTLVENGANAPQLLDGFGSAMSADFVEQLHGNAHSALQLLLSDIHNRFRVNGSDAARFNIPEPELHQDELSQERQFLADSKLKNGQLAQQRLPILTFEQRSIFETVVHAATHNLPLVLFLEAKAGRGKTFLLQTIAAELRARELIVLPIASTGIAALDHDRGSTAHNRFQIPIRESGASTSEMIECAVDSNCMRARLLCATSLFIWDEVPMAHRADVEAVDRLLRRLHSKPTAVFGGAVFVLAGDWHQIPPVVPFGGSIETISASLKSSSTIWPHVKTFQLSFPQRDAQDPEWSHFVDSIGSSPSTDVTLFPDLRMFDTEHDALAWVHPNLSDSRACASSAVLCCLNTTVDSINKQALQMLPGEMFRFYSSDTVVEATGMSDNFVTTEFLNSISFTGVPDHLLQLKLGAVCLVTRNVSVKQRLMNGTKVCISRIVSPFLVELTNLDTSEKVLLPRINFRFSLPKTPITVNRRQFPLKLCYAMTINKSQGKTLQRVCVDTRTPVFSHGQLYVAFSRVQSRESISVLRGEKPVVNVVYSQLLA